MVDYLQTFCSSLDFQELFNQVNVRIELCELQWWGSNVENDGI